MLKKYEIIKQIGRGAFSSVYLGKHKITGESVAIKIEKTDDECTLRHESKILLYLAGTSGVPIVRAFGVEKTHRFLVMDFYEKSLSSPGACVEKMRIFQEMIDIVKGIHAKLIIHRDIKPANFMFRGGGDALVLIDFGLASVSQNASFCGGGERRISKNGIIGTPKYISPFLHEGYEANAQDDFISVAYVALYLWRNGELPWNHCGNNMAEIYREKCNIVWRDDEKHIEDFIKMHL